MALATSLTERELLDLLAYAVRELRSFDGCKGDQGCPHDHNDCDGPGTCNCEDRADELADEINERLPWTERVAR